MAAVAALWGMHNGLNLDNLEVTTDAEIDAFLADARKARGALDPGPLYNMTANSVWLYARPDFAKLHRRVIAAWGTHGLDPIITAASFTNLHAYINQAWEIGIENCTRGLQMRGVTKAQLMETIMHAQLTAGIRGLQCVYRALGIILNDYVERPEPAVFPEGWAPDMQAFYCGLDTTTKELTPQDKRAIEEWYERTIGEVPRWVSVLATIDPISLKAWRAKWEGAFRGALPKQMMPYLSLYHHTIIGNKGGMREAALLGKAWGMSNAYIVNTMVMAAYYFTGYERLELIDDMLVELLS
jgi:hypothetical protein